MNGIDDARAMLSMAERDAWKNNRDVIQTLVDTFSTEPVCVADALSDGRFFSG